jgi:hypothetical protein
MLQSAEFIQNTAKGPDVTLVVVRLLLTEFRGQVVGCSYHSMSKVSSLVEHFSYTQVTYLDLVFFGQKHVDGLDVSVQDLVSMEVLESLTHLNKELPNLLLR